MLNGSANKQNYGRHLWFGITPSTNRKKTAYGLHIFVKITLTITDYDTELLAVSI